MVPLPEQPQRRASVWPATHNQAAFHDCLFLSLVFLASLMLYVWDLGFYSDDWAFLANFSLAEDQSLRGLFWSFDDPHTRMRPVQGLYFSALYWVFGLNPTGYHLVNAAVLLSGILLFYHVLRELDQNRLLAVALPLVYGFLPHYSTDRFWFAAFQISLSMALYFLSLYCDLRALRARPVPLWIWKCFSIVCLVGSVLAYEVFLPLFLLLNPLLVVYRWRQLSSSVPRSQVSPRKLAGHLGSNVLALMLLVIFKMMTTTRLEPADDLLTSVIDIVQWAFIVNYGVYGLNLPRFIGKIIYFYPDAITFTIGVILSLVIFGYLYHITTRSRAEFPSRAEMLKLSVWGLAVFGLGYAIFPISGNIIFTPTGIANRAAIAAASGVAISMVGASGWVSELLLPERWYKLVFCTLIAGTATSGFIINNTLASFWITAYRQEQVILADIHQHFPTMESGSTLILDGICPYIGPAVVFESSWDLRGALRLIYRDATIQADVVTPHLKVEEDGLSTLLYGSIYSHYPYNGKLFVYHFGQKTTHWLTDAQTARRYFAEFNPDHNNGCPRGNAGHGVPIF